MAYQVKKIDHEAVKRQLQSGNYEPQQKANNVTKFQDYLKTDQGQANFQNQLANSSYVQGNLAKLNKNQAPTQVASVQVNQPLMQSQQGQGNAQSYIDQLNNARLQQTLAGLDKSRDASLSNLQSEKSSIQPRYYDQRNQQAAGTQQQARNFAEFMAARGGTSGGANAQAEISRQGMLQGNLGSLGRQEAQAYTDIGRRTTDVENAYQSDIAGAVAGIEGDRMQTLLSDYYRAQDRGDRLAQQAIMNEINRAQLTGTFQGQQTLAGLQNSQQYGLQQGSLTGQYQGAPTLAGQQYQSQEQQRGLDNQYRQDSFEFTKAQNDWENTFRNQQFDFQKANALWDQNFQNKNFQQSINQFAQQMGLNYSQLGQRDKEFVAEQAYRNEAMQLNKDQFKYSQTQDATEAGFRRLDNEARSSQETKPMGAGDYKTNPDFAQDYSFIIQSPEQALGALEQNAEQFIQTYGLDGYRALLERAQGGY